MFDLRVRTFRSSDSKEVQWPSVRKKNEESTMSEQNNDLKKKIAQLGLECRASIPGGFASSINQFDQLDADYEQLEYNFKQSDLGENTLNK